MQRNLIETIAHAANKMLEHKLKNASFDKSYSGIISDILFEPDTPRDSSQFGTYKIKFGTMEKTFRLDDNFVHEIGERVNVYIYENNPNHIVVEPVIKHMPPCEITYDENENKYIEHRRTKTNGKIYETMAEIQITENQNDDGSQEVTEMKLPNSQTIKFKGFDKF